MSASEATSLYVLPPVFAHYKKQYTRVNLNIVRAEHLPLARSGNQPRGGFRGRVDARQGFAAGGPDRFIATRWCWPWRPRIRWPCAKWSSSTRCAVSDAVAEAGTAANAAQQLFSASRTAAAHRHGAGFERAAEAADLRGAGHGLSAARQRSGRRARRPAEDCRRWRACGCIANWR